MHTNALNPMMYPSLRRFETEVVSMSAWMLGGDGNVAGSLTSGLCIFLLGSLSLWSCCRWD
jgi:sphinganine-1-phosphate aldolase